MKDDFPGAVPEIPVSDVDTAAVNDILNGLSIANHDYCIVTDRDGDKAFLVWKGQDTSPNVGGGSQEWTGGTGKYSGIKGNMHVPLHRDRYHVGILARVGGEWQLP